MQTITAKYPGKCKASGKPIKPGDKIYRVEINGGSYWVLEGETLGQSKKQEVTPTIDTTAKGLLKNAIGYFAPHFKDEYKEVQVFDLTSQCIKTVFKFTHKFSPYFCDKKCVLYVDKDNVYLEVGYRKNFGGVMLDCVVIENNKDNINESFLGGADVDPEIYWEVLEMYLD